MNRLIISKRYKHLSAIIEPANDYYVFLQNPHFICVEVDDEYLCVLKLTHNIQPHTKLEYGNMPTYALMIPPSELI
jgi:hypothetical protein